MDSQIPKVLFIFVVFYAALIFLGSLEPLQQIELSLDFSMLNYSLILLPVVGFFFIYLVMPFAKNELGFGDVFKYSFPVIFFISSFVAFMVAVYYFFGNQAALQGVDISAYNLDYWSMFLSSTFVYFVFGGIGGWLAHILIENFEEISK